MDVKRFVEDKNEKFIEVKPSKLYPYIAIFVGIIVLIVLAGIYSDFLWFQALDYESVFLKVLFSKIWVALGAAAFLFVVIYANTFIAFPPKRKNIGILSIAIGSLIIGTMYKNSYLTVLKYFNQNSIWHH